MNAISTQIPDLLKRGQELGFTFRAKQRPQPNAQGRVPTTMEWARRLTDTDIQVLRGQAAYSEKVPNVDEGFTQADVQDPQRRAAVVKTILARLQKAHQDRPNGYLVRHVPEEDVRQLQELTGHLRAGLFVTKFRKLFTRGEMNDDLVIVPARVGEHEDSSEYEEIFPSSPP